VNYYDYADLAAFTARFQWSIASSPPIFELEVFYNAANNLTKFV